MRGTNGPKRKQSATLGSTVATSRFITHGGVQVQYLSTVVDSTVATVPGTGLVAIDTSTVSARVLSTVHVYSAIRAVVTT